MTHGCYGNTLFGWTTAETHGTYIANMRLCPLLMHRTQPICDLGLKGFCMQPRGQVPSSYMCREDVTFFLSSPVSQAQAMLCILPCMETAFAWISVCYILYQRGPQLKTFYFVNWSEKSVMADPFLNNDILFPNFRIQQSWAELKILNKFSTSLFMEQQMVSFS